MIANFAILCSLPSKKKGKKEKVQKNDNSIAESNEDLTEQVRVINNFF